MKKILCFSILGLALTACSSNGTTKSFDEADSTAVDTVEIADSVVIDTAAVDTICVD